MTWLLGGYLWLFVHRPFEVWPVLGVLQVERAYMIVMLVVWAVTPGKRLVGNRIHAALAVFSGALAVTWLLSPYADSPGCTEVVENYFKVVVFYLLVITTVQDERGLRRLVLLYLAAVALYMGHSLLEYANGRIERRMSIDRMVGVDVTYADPNAFASGLLFALPMTLPFWFERPRRVPRWLLLGFTGSVGLCILLTGSRAGFVGVAAFGVMALLLAVRSKLAGVALVGVAGAAALAVLSVALPEELQGRYLTLIDSSHGPQNAQSSAEGRWHGLVAGLVAWQESPAVGHGPGSFPYSTHTGFQAHNLYGQVLSEMGVLGAAALLGVLVCFAWNWLETRRLHRQLAGPAPAPKGLPYRVSQAVGLAVLLLLLLGCAGHNLYRYHWQWFAAFQAVAVHCLRVRAEASARASSYALPYLILPPRREPAASLRGRGRPEAPPALG
jgi:O-antigen ligase